MARESQASHFNEASSASHLERKEWRLFTILRVRSANGNSRVLAVTEAGFNLKIQSHFGTPRRHGARVPGSQVAMPRPAAPHNNPAALRPCVTSPTAQSKHTVRIPQPSLFVSCRQLVAAPPRLLSNPEPNSKPLQTAPNHPLFYPTSATAISPSRHLRND